MKKIIFIISLVLIASFAEAQTGIGTTTPNASAKLEVFSSNKGFLPPRISLTDAYDQTTITSPVTGLLVYCKGDAGLAAGYYYWNGSAWATIATAGGSGSVVAEYGTQVLASNVAINSSTATDVLSFTLPTAGTWELNYFLRAQGTPTFAGEFAIYDPTGTIVPNSEVLAAYGENASTGTGIVRVTTTGSAVYKLKAWASSGTYNASSDNNGRTVVTWQKISGNAPVTGQSVDYGIARYTGADGSALSVGANVAFDATSSGNLTWNTNKFTLKANKTYIIESSLAIYAGSPSAGRFQIYDYTNVKSLANGLFMSQGGSGTYYPNANSPMKCIVTPTTDIQVGIRLEGFYGTAPGIVGSTSTVSTNGSSNASYFLVEQIGSSAIVNPWVLSGNNVYNTTGNVGIGTTAPSSALTVGSATGSIGGEITLNPQGATNEGGQISIKRSLSGGTVDWTVDHYGTSNADARFRIFGGSSETNGISIKENGNVGLGTINPTAKLNLSGGGIRIHTGFGNSTTRPALNTSTIGNYEIRAIGGFTQADATDDGFLRLSAGGGTSSAAQASIDLSGYSVNAEMNNNIVMRTKGVESLRIDENGRLGIGTSSPYNKLHVQSTEGTSVYIESTTSDNNGMMVLNANTNQNWSNNWHEFIYFRNQGNNIGGIIASNGGNMVSYGTTSDYRLKRNLREFSGLDLVNKIKTYDFAWKRDSSRMFGVMAHELQSILPYAVNGQKDAVDVNGKIIPQSVDYGKLTPILVKAIQEQDVKIKEQEGKILKLKNQKDSIEKRVSDLELLIKKLIEKNN